MKLRSIQVQNYRSIIETQSLHFKGGLTVILGPNNEGKSNLLRAIVLAMECLKAIRSPFSLSFKKDVNSFRIIRGSYDWEYDFPKKLQEQSPNGQTILSLEFELTGDECSKFRIECGCTINGVLPLEIKVGSRGTEFKVKKPGRGAKTYERKSREIARFISMCFDFQYIPAIRPSKLSLEVVADLVERELAILSEDENYKNALKTIDELQKPVYQRLETDVQKYLKQLLPSVKAIKISAVSSDGLRSRLRSPNFIVDDGTATNLEAKGDGIKSLIAISLMRASKVGKRACDLVVAIEEPESHLHPGAVRELAFVLNELANENQVIITTHNPLLVNRNRISDNIIVSKSKARPASSIKAIRECLGIHISDNLSSAEYVILVEGITDIQSLEAIFKARSQKFSELLSNGKVVFDYMEGTGNIVYKISTLRLMVANPILLTDDDIAGRECEKKAKNNGALPEKYHFCLKRSGCEETELEDIISPDCYWASVEKVFGVKLDRNVFDASNGKWSKRIKSTFTAGGKPWNNIIENEVKKEVANCVCLNPKGAISINSEHLIDNIINAILSLVL